MPSVSRKSGLDIELRNIITKIKVRIIKLGKRKKGNRKEIRIKTFLIREE